MSYETSDQKLHLFSLLLLIPALPQTHSEDKPAVSVPWAPLHFPGGETSSHPPRTCLGNSLFEMEP